MPLYILYIIMLKHKLNLCFSTIRGGEIMSLVINGTTVPNTGNIIINNTTLDRVVCNDITVWQRIVFTSQEFFYTGDVSEWICPGDGIYKLEVWGASGSSSGPLAGGKGGYCWGNAELETGDILYICVGGANGYNGGGIGGENSESGGGATSIAKNASRGILRNYVNNKSEVLIVAGGGGSSDYEDWDLGLDGYGGHGGGLVGGNGWDYDEGSSSGTGGTQTDPGQSFGAGTAGFGFGAPDCIPDISYACGGLGGGGWYGGGCGSWSNGCHGGGGGSSYYGTLTSSGTTPGVNEGNGKAKITFIPQ